MMEKDDRLIEKIRQELDRSLDDLDAKTCARLSQARHQAMEKPQKRSLFWLFWGSVPAIAAALVVLALNLSDPQQIVPPVPQPGDLSILTATEPLEFYQEEIEFYEWLSEEFASEKELPASGRSAAIVDDFVSGSAGRGLAGTTEPRTARLSGGV